VLSDARRSRHGRGDLHLPTPQGLAAMPAVDHWRASPERHAVVAVLALAPDLPPRRAT
jgi:hypothetical protein